MNFKCPVTEHKTYPLSGICSNRTCNFASRIVC